MRGAAVALSPVFGVPVGSISSLPARHWAMLDPLGHHENLALIEGHRAVPQLDLERACEHKEEIVGVRSCQLMRTYAGRCVDRRLTRLPCRRAPATRAEW